MKLPVLSDVVAMLSKQLGFSVDEESQTNHLPNQSARSASRRLRSRANKLNLQLSDDDIVSMVKNYRR
jgi:hypothetical protein